MVELMGAGSYLDPARIFPGAASESGGMEKAIKADGS